MPYKDKEKQREANRKYYWKNREKLSKKKKAYWKKHKETLWKTRLSTTTGTYYGLCKRDRPKICELCDKKRHRLEYHHWDKDNINMGMWLCRSCHIFANKLENKVNNVYSSLKAKIENEEPERLKRENATKVKERK